MSDNTGTPLSVSIQELPSIHVACIEYKPNAEQGNRHDEIGSCFRRVQAWSANVAMILCPGLSELSTWLTISY